MQQMKPELVTPAAYAKSRGLNRSTVCRQIRADKIPAHGGLVDPAEADRARTENLNTRRRWEAERRKAKAQQQPKSEAVEVSADSLAEYALLDLIRERAAALLPTVARRLGLPEYIAVGACDLFDSLLANCGADRDYFSPTGDGYQWPPVGNQLSPKRASAKVESAADAFFDRLEGLFEEIRTGAKCDRAVGSENEKGKGK